MTAFTTLSTFYSSLSLALFDIPKCVRIRILSLTVVHFLTFYLNLDRKEIYKNP